MDTCEERMSCLTKIQEKYQISSKKSESDYYKIYKAKNRDTGQLVTIKRFTDVFRSYQHCRKVIQEL